MKKVTRLGDPEELERHYERLNVEIVYNATGRTLDRSVRPVGRDKPVSEAGVGHYTPALPAGFVEARWVRASWSTVCPRLTS
ncbi:hypothetical protein ACFWN2_06725 [Lentzea sp. NPDC058436]|uniref:hypothetical protein n=1 Tax=Lentzea sp. NPDC058436 TaxID=3346499 RepID=UPI00365E8772